MDAIASILARVRARPAAVFLLVYLALFLNVVVPGHTRGAVTLDGRHTGNGTCCCCGGSDEPAGGDRRPGPSQRDREHCSICNFAARVVPPPPCPTCGSPRWGWSIGFPHPDRPSSPPSIGS